MKGTDLITLDEAREWVTLDYDEKNLQFLIQVAYDVVADCINDIDSKIKSDKFKRKLKLCILNTMINMQDDKGVTTDKKEIYKYINQSMMLQLQYGSYSDSDV